MLEAKVNIMRNSINFNLAGDGNRDSFFLMGGLSKDNINNEIGGGLMDLRLESQEDEDEKYVDELFKNAFSPKRRSQQEEKGGQKQQRAKSKKKKKSEAAL